MAKTPRWRGSSDLNLDPAYPIFEDHGGGITRTQFKYVGPWAKCMAERPKVGAVPQSYDTLFITAPVRVSHGPGGTGILEFTATNEVRYEMTGPDPNAASKPVYEIEWVENQRPLETNPFFAVDSDADTKLTADDLDAIEAWRNATTSADRADKYGAMTTNAQLFVDKLRAGEEAWVDFNPVARVTTMHATKPTTGNCGKRSAPPDPVKLDGFEYLKTMDRVVTSGKLWQRIQEWKGALKWDHDLYEEA